jgi:FSR family fosmidomycin resistance protein-like MFS transporter
LGGASGVVLVLLAIELIDELVWGSFSAAWPLIRHDLDLGYAEIGLLLGIPSLVGSVLEPVIGLAGDTRRRRTLIVLGGIGFAVAAALSATAVGFWTLLLAQLVANPSSGAFVSLAQASLMDGDPPGRERNMARWTAVGSVGYVAGPVLIAGAVLSGIGWRGVLALLAAAAVPLAFAVRRISLPAPRDGEEPGSAGVRALVAAVRDRNVVRWLALLQAGDLLGDVFHGLLALYLVDVASSSAIAAALGVAVWTGAGFIGDLALVALLRHVDSRAYLRASAIAALVCYPLFLPAPSTSARLVLLATLGLLNSGWYALPKAGLYTALPGRSGTAVAAAGVAGLVSAGVPAALGILAGHVGLGPVMWALLLAPVALFVLTPRGRGRQIDLKK